MQIDESVEARLREAYSAVIDRDGDRMAAALRELDQSQSEHALHLALFVCAFVTKDVYRDGPTEDNLLELGRQIVDGESGWVPLDLDKIAELLRAALKGDVSLATVDPAEVPPLAIIVGGHLLAAFRLKDQRWWQYLEEIWEALLAAPDPK
jgi:hypothetical protein